MYESIDNEEPRFNFESVDMAMAWQVGYEDHNEREQNF